MKNYSKRTGHFLPFLRKSIFPVCLVTLCFFVSGFSVTAAEAATIGVSPASGNYQVGQTFSVTVMVDGAQTAFNAAQATVSASSNLAVESVTLADCNFALVKTPTVNNLSFAGAILGGSSTKCTVYTMQLKAVSSGTGTIALSNGSVKSYSGSKEILSSFTNGSYTLSASSLPEATVTPTPTTAATTGSSTTSTQQLPSYAVALTIVTSDNKPQSDAVVTIDNKQQATTNKDGKVKFTTVDGGVHKIVATDKSGKPITEQVVNLTGNNPVITLGMAENKPQAKKFPWMLLISLVIAAIAFGIILLLRRRSLQGK